MDTYDAEPLDIPIDPSWHITGSLLPGFDAPVYRFIPGITRSEGLFVCVMKKRGERLEVRGKRNDLRQLQGLSILLPLTSNLSPLNIDLPYSEALKYLRGEALVLPADAPRGIITVTYKGIPLGPVKNIGNRANNLYPKPWRIKTTHLPTEPVEILSKIYSLQSKI
jgi:NOL1/NOP2/fmu family ribosome biogenesis protein